MLGFRKIQLSIVLIRVYCALYFIINRRDKLNIQRLTQLRTLLGQLDNSNNSARVLGLNGDFALASKSAGKDAVVFGIHRGLGGRVGLCDGLAVLDGGQDT